MVVYRVKNGQFQIKSVGGLIHIVKGKGSITFPHCQGFQHVNDVLHIPRVTKNLLLIGAIIDNKCCNVVFGKAYCWVNNSKTKQVMAINKRDNTCGLTSWKSQSMPLHNLQQTCFKSMEVMSPITLWHKRLGHLKFQSLLSLSQGKVGMPKFPIEN